MRRVLRRQLDAPGASGGPVVNEDGEAIGVVSQRAMTRVDVGQEKVKVPSGCTVALSLVPLEYIARNTSCNVA